MFHIFDIDIAAQYGMLEAVLLQNLYFWITKNRANGAHLYEGRYWTYNSTKAFTELFPYVSQRQIQYALKHLKEEGLIITGNYNKAAFDHTAWYALTDLGESIMQKCKIDNANLSNRLGEFVQPIPDINTDINTDKKENTTFGSTKENRRQTFVKPTLEEVRAYCLERKNRVNAEKFWDYYNSNGWRVGKNPMKDWKAAVRTWEQSDKRSGQRITNPYYDPNEASELNF